jgi:hypothetical protein
MKICITLFFALFTLSYFFFSPAAYAQEPADTLITQQNADTLFQIGEDSIKVSEPFIIFDSLQYRFIADGNFTRGNVNRTLMILRAEITYNGPIVSLATNPRFTYGEQNNNLAERDTYIDLFIDIYKERKVYGFGLATIETSNLRGIDLRQLAGGGAGFRLVQRKQNTLTLTNAIIYESTEFRERQAVTTLRNSTRLKGKHALLQNKIRFTHITFFQPSLTNISNIRWNTLLALELPLSKWVTFRSSFENSYESIVEPTRKRNDSRLTFGISIGNRP